LFSGKEVLRMMNVIRSRQHNLFTEQVNKIALFASDDKRIIQQNKYLSLWIQDRLTWETNKGTDRGGDRVRTEGLQQRQGETDKVAGEVTG